ncbi:ImpA family type VI secretion system protein [Beijerinckia mobilis]|uniref:type VI secretion system protein TssA n=1 Tax=Beijerinckia mobilis TaxID=231434 RepID=UPI00054CF7BF|nr:type VI secretion system ImpA family N-terminal domain-containing protein [Beijerinckia mobilis]
MVIVDPNLLTSPIPGDDPCGPDLDAAGDAGFLNFFAFAPFQLPDSFFDNGTAFDPNDQEFREATTPIPAMLADLMKRTRDLRLIIFLARFAILKRSLAEFCEAIAAIRYLLEQHWDGVHPRVEDGSYATRINALEELNDPLVRFSLQFVTLLADRHRGAIAFRSMALAVSANSTEGDHKPAGGRIAALDEAQIKLAFQEAGEEAIASVRKAFQEIAEDLLAIGMVCTDKTSGRDVPNFDRIGDRIGVARDVKGVLALFAGAFPGTEGAVSAEEAPDAPQAAQGAIGSAAQARFALQCVKDYFSSFEPSSPALPLVAQALELQGKTFVEILSILAPDNHLYARYAIGEQQFFKLAIAPLGPLTETKPEYFQERPVRAPREARRLGVRPFQDLVEAPPKTTCPDDGLPPESPAQSDENSLPANEAFADETGEGSPAIMEGDGFDAPEVAFERHDENPNDTVVETRMQALSLMKDVGSYFRAAEPSSPIPWLIDRARALAEKDFLSVLDAVFERDAFLLSS